MDSALDFVESGGGEAVITSPEAFEASIRDDAGTRVRR
jgi:carbamate kinase